MGVMTSNRKRPLEWRSVNCTISSPNSLDYPKSKRARFSPIPLKPGSTVLSSNNTGSRISLYPEPSPLPREVHAPCRPRKFDFLKNSRRESSLRTGSNFQEEEFGNEMGNIIGNKYQRAKKSSLGSIRHLSKGKEVIEVDTDTEKYEDSEDSSLEEVQIIEDGREGRSVVTDQRLQGSAEVVAEIQDLDAMVVDGGLQQQPLSAVVPELNNSNLNVIDAVHIWEPLSQIPEHDLKSVDVYKKLLEAVDRRAENIKRLSFEIELNEKRRATFDLLRPKKDQLVEVPHEPFVSLTKEEEIEVANAFSASRKSVLVTHENSNIEITGEKFQCLRPGAWLNDEVINLYLELLKEREGREPHKFLKCHFFNTFFYKKLMSGRNGYDFKSVRRWTSQRKLGYGLHECDKIFVPIHKEIHWCLAVINKKDKKFQYLDSLKGMDTKVLKVLARYFEDEVKDKTGEDIDVSSWEKDFVEDLPEQENGYDCGVFMIKYADFYSRGLGLCFSQDHMPYFRLRTAKEILRLKAD